MSEQMNEGKNIIPCAGYFTTASQLELGRCKLPFCCRQSGSLLGLDSS
jgi:hypothetical protein